ncbi:heparinase II/III family protein [Vreelandella andesensis]|uniref:heparinase II/III family protein n=1 Tax=Vreelandella andesensis TaxID=447567 RepID=UPI00142D210A|nr:heparinase II/III family protein [Halomonas andesensis]
MTLGPFKPVNFTRWGSWEQNPLDNRSWQWRLNWLSFLSYLMAYHHASENDAVLDFARESVESWLDTYLETDTTYPFEFIWHDHATALRAEQLVLLAYYSRRYAPNWAKLNAKFLVYVEKALKTHGNWLAKDSFYSEHTNHGLEQARVLLLLGTVFEGEQAKQWQQIAQQRISSELEFSFTDEGVHVENSPAYHIFVFKVFLGIIKDYPKEVLGGLSSQFDVFAHKALRFITHILRPDGLLPPIGDTEQLPTSNMYRDAFGHMPEYQHLLYALTNGKQGERPPESNVVYPHSGYAVFRDLWPGQEDYRNALHCIVKVGCSSRYHHQQDEGHISLYAGGEDWLIDSGLYNYSGKDPVRRYMRSRSAHNIPLVSDAGYDADFEHRLSAWEVTTFDDSPSLPFVEMALNVLPQVAHKRRVALDSALHELSVVDQFHCNDGQPREVILQWHFPQDKQISIQGNRAIISSATGSQLLMDIQGAQPDSLSVVKGRQGERVFSAFSAKANQFESSQLLRVVFAPSSALEVTSRFHLALSPQRKLAASHARLVKGESLEALTALMDRSGIWQHTLVLGNTSLVSRLGKLHQDKGCGFVSVLTDNDRASQHLDDQLEDEGLKLWAQSLSLAGSASCDAVAGDVSDHALRGLKGISLLIIGASDFSDRHLEALLGKLLPMLLSRLAPTAQVWLTADMNVSLKALCQQWADRHGLKVAELAF